MVERFAIDSVPRPFRSTVAEASAKPTRYSRAMPRFEPQAPPPAVPLGWLVLKNVVPAMVTALPTTFSPAASDTNQPLLDEAVLVSTLELVASKRSPAVNGAARLPSAAAAIETVVLLAAPTSASELSRSLIM